MSDNQLIKNKMQDCDNCSRNCQFSKKQKNILFQIFFSLTDTIPFLNRNQKDKVCLSTLNTLEYNLYQQEQSNEINQDSVIEKIFIINQIYKLISYVITRNDRT